MLCRAPPGLFRPFAGRPGLLQPLLGEALFDSFDSCLVGGGCALEVT